MRLKRIDIFGFKSFADKVSIDFDDGITGIVGPNGCGKSNLIEAVRWALGEQNSRLIRAVKMEEVIFNGTVERPPLAFSEIDLTFEAKGETPSPLGFHEITFKRRVKRDGFCEYFINQTPCLLRDIIDTLRNIGITSRSYSLFSIDAIKRILDDDSQVRRDMFAEVSGIAKYQAQKSVTMSRLKDTEADILRLQDKIDEVNTNLTMLKKDLKKANHYKNLKKQFESKLLLFSRRKRDEIRKSEIEIAEEINKSVIKRSQIEENARLLGAEADSLWSAEEKTVKELSVRKEKFDMDLSVYSQMNAELLGKKQELKYLTGKIEEHEKELTSMEELVPALNETAREMERKFKELSADEETKKNEKTQILSSLEKEKSLIEKLKNNLGNESEKRDEAVREDNFLQKEISALSEKKTLKTGLLRKLGEAKENRKIEKEEAEEKYGVLEESISRLDSEQSNLEVSMSHLQEKSSVLNSERESLSSLSSSHQNDLASCESELSLLSEQQKDLEGYDEATKYLLKNCGLSTLNDSLEVEKGYELAVEIALGSALGAVIVEQDQLKTRVEELERESMGKGWFLVKKTGLEALSEEMPDDLDPLSSHVKADDPSVKDFAERLLKGWYVVSGGDVVETAGKHPSLNAVSPDGHSVRRGVLYSMGSQKPKIIGRKERIEELSKIKENLKNRIGETEERREINRRELDETIKNLGEKADVLKMAVDKKATLHTEIKNLNYKLSVIEKTDEEESKEEKLLNEELGEIEESLREKNRRQAKLLVELENIAARIESVRSELQETEKKIEPSLAQLSEIESEAARLGERKKALGEKIEEKRAEALGAAARIQELGKILAEEKEKAKEEESRVLSIEEKSRENAAAIENSKKEIESLQAAIETTRQNIRNAEEKIRELEKTKTELMDIAQTYNVKMADLKGELNSITGELETVFGFGPEKLDEVEPSEEEVTKDDIFRIKSRLMSMGSVNENAEEEYAEILERFNFLGAQKDDLENTKKGLKDTINSIDKVAREKFLETFEAVRTNFKNIFSVLFNSKEESGADFLADLQLETEKDPLESDIKVLAVPPGKKLSTTRLLSTGEQSFTALSLLYALHQMRLSPLVVLDEVDAPLDDSNVEIFIRFLKTIALESQVVLVTHNRRTMEFCQGLYGITMEEKGVSSVVSVNLEKIDEFLGEDN